MRLVSYNVQYCTGKDGRADIDRIVAEIENADVIAVQEIDRYWSRSAMTTPAACTEAWRVVPSRPMPISTRRAITSRMACASLRRSAHAPVAFIELASQCVNRRMKSFSMLKPETPRCSQNQSAHA